MSCGTRGPCGSRVFGWPRGPPICGNKTSWPSDCDGCWYEGSCSSRLSQLLASFFEVYKGTHVGPVLFGLDEFDVQSDLVVAHHVHVLFRA